MLVYKKDNSTNYFTLKLLSLFPVNMEIIDQDAVFPEVMTRQTKLRVLENPPLHFCLLSSSENMVIFFFAKSTNRTIRFLLFWIRRSSYRTSTQLFSFHTD